MEENETLCVGIDLGTSRSSVSASNGERHVVDSYVGWPVDMVARKVVQKPVLVGRDALDNRSMLDLRRPLERGVIREGSERDEEAVLELLRHLMGLVGLKQNGKSRPQVRAVVGVPAASLSREQAAPAGRHGRPGRQRHARLRAIRGGLWPRGLAALHDHRHRGGHGRSVHHAGPLPVRGGPAHAHRRGRRHRRSARARRSASGIPRPSSRFT